MMHTHEGALFLVVRHIDQVAANVAAEEEWGLLYRGKFAVLTCTRRTLRLLYPALALHRSSMSGAAPRERGSPRGVAQ